MNLPIDTKFDNENIVFIDHNVYIGFCEYNPNLARMIHNTPNIIKDHPEIKKTQPFCKKLTPSG